MDERPPDVTDQLRRAAHDVAAGERDLRDAEARLAHWQQQQTAGLRGLTRWRREQHHEAVYQARFQGGAIEREAQRLDSARREQQQLLQQQAAGVAFDQANQWHRDRIGTLEHQLDLYWANAVLDAARDGYPAAYGTQRLQAARHTIIEEIETLADRPAASQPHQPAQQIDTPLQALGDLDRAIIQAAQRQGIQLVETSKPHRQHRMDPRPDIHQQHKLHQHLYPTEGPSIGIDM